MGSIKEDLKWLTLHVPGKFDELPDPYSSMVEWINLAEQRGPWKTYMKIAHSNALCQQQFTSTKDKWDRHLQLLVPNPTGNTQALPIQPTSFICYTCGAVMSTAAGMKHHRHKAHGEYNCHTITTLIQSATHAERTSTILPGSTTISPTAQTQAAKSAWQHTTNTSSPIQSSKLQHKKLP